MRVALIAGVLILACSPLASWAQGAAPDNPPAARQPVPPPEKLREAEKTIRDLFADDFKKGGRENDLTLARQMLRQQEGAKDDPAGRYELLLLPLDLATRHADWDIAQQAITALESAFEVDGTKVRLEALAVCLRNAKTKDQFQALARGALALASDELGLEEFDSAAAFCERAAAAARSAQDPDLTAAATKQQQAIQDLRAALAKVKQVQTDLKRDPNDPTGNLIMGRFYVFQREDWPQALPFLAKGGDARWAAAAKADMAEPAEALDQFAVAEKWYEIAKSAPKTEQEPLQERALLWYEKALPTLTGLQKMKAEKCVAELKPAEVVSTPGNGTATRPVKVKGGGRKAQALLGSGLPTADEMRELRDLAAKSHDTEFAAKARELRTRLARGLEACTDREVRQRVEMEKQIMDLGVRVLGAGDARRFKYSPLGENLYLYAGAAESPRDLLGRLSFVLPEAVKLEDPDTRRSYAPGILTLGLQRFLEVHAKDYGTPKSRGDLCEWLMDKGVDAVVLRRLRDSYLTGAGGGKHKGL